MEIFSQTYLDQLHKAIAAAGNEPAGPYLRAALTSLEVALGHAKAPPTSPLVPLVIDLLRGLIAEKLSLTALPYLVAHADTLALVVHSDNPHDAAQAQATLWATHELGSFLPGPGAAPDLSPTVDVPVSALSRKTR